MYEALELDASEHRHVAEFYYHLEVAIDSFHKFCDE